MKIMIITYFILMVFLIIQGYANRIIPKDIDAIIMTNQLIPNEKGFILTSKKNDRVFLPFSEKSFHDAINKEIIQDISSLIEHNSYYYNNEQIINDLAENIFSNNSFRFQINSIYYIGRKDNIYVTYDINPGYIRNY